MKMVNVKCEIIINVPSKSPHALLNVKWRCLSSDHIIVIQQIAEKKNSIMLPHIAVHLILMQFSTFFQLMMVQ